MKKQKKASFDDYDDDSEYAKSVREQNRRRPVRNWTKVYIEHADEYDDLETFHKF